MKRVVTAIFVILFLAIIFIASDIKNAYQFLPIKENPTLVVPPYADWREFNSTIGHFKVDLPAPPQYAKEIVPIPNTDKKRRYEMYVSEKLDGAVFLITLITYPKDVDISDSGQLLHDVVEEMMQTKPDNRLTKTKDTYFKHYKAVDFTITNNKFNVEGKAFLMDRTVYLLSYIAKISDFAVGEYEHFINSFQLEKNTSETPATK